MERHRHQPQLAHHGAVLRRGRADRRRRHTTTIGTSQSIVDGLKSTVAQMVSNSSFGVRPTAIYANPVLLDLIDREMKSEFNVVLGTKEITSGFTVKMLSTQAGDIPLIPEWTLPYTGTPGSGSAVLPAYIVTEDLIEYHWLSDPNPRIFQLGVPGSLRRSTWSSSSAASSSHRNHRPGSRVSRRKHGQTHLLYSILPPRRRADRCQLSRHGQIGRA